MTPDGSIVIATGNDDVLGVYTCTPYNSYGTAGESRPTRVLLKVRPGGAPSSPVPPWSPVSPSHPVPPIPGPAGLHAAPQGGILPGGGPGAGDPLHRPWGSSPHHHLAAGMSRSSGEPAEPSWDGDAAFGHGGVTPCVPSSVTSLLVPAEGAQGTLLVLPSEKPMQSPAPGSHRVVFSPRPVGGRQSSRPGPGGVGVGVWRHQRARALPCRRAARGRAAPGWM